MFFQKYLIFFGILRYNFSLGQFSLEALADKLTNKLFASQIAKLWSPGKTFAKPSQDSKHALHCNQNIWSRGNYGIYNDLLNIKGQENSSYTRKMKTVSKILPNTMDSLGPPQARKKHFIYTWQGWDSDMEPWPWNHLLAWGGPKVLSRRGGQKMASRGGRPAIYPPHAHLCFTAFFTLSGHAKTSSCI